MQETDLPESADAPGDSPRTVALAADLLFAGRIRGTAGAAGRSVTLARRPQDVLNAVRAGAVRVLLDLDARSVDVPALIRSLRADDATRHAEIIAWVSHVRTDAIAEARAAGADRVLARSAFVRELPELLL
jgi:CheY-like chemotaxis protein